MRKIVCISISTLFIYIFTSCNNSRTYPTYQDIQDTLTQEEIENGSDIEYINKNKILDETKQIYTFYGIRLGMTFSEVESVISEKGKTINQSSSTHNLYIVDNPELAGYTFNRLSLKFNDSRLCSGVFFSESSAGGSPSADTFVYVERSAKYFKQIFNAMHSNYISKYGEPLIEEDEEVIWQTNQNQIILQYSFSDVMESEWMRQSRTYIKIQYKYVDPSDY